MASWLNHCSFDRRAPNPSETGLVACPRWASLLWLALACTGCGQAQTLSPPAPTAATTVAAGAAAAAPVATGDTPGSALCKPAGAGFLRAKMQGAVEAELDWKAGNEPQCLGGPRPTGDGLRLVYKGTAADGPLVVVIGIGGLQPGESGRNVPANLTVIREGTGVFYATQGDDKCAFDSLEQVALGGHPARFTLSGRGYCTQPARALGTDGAVLMSRFDVEAIVEHAESSTE